MLRHIKPGMLVFSVLYILLGLLLLLAPQAVADVFCIALGLLVVLCGLQSLYGYFKKDNGSIRAAVSLLLSLPTIALGMWALLCTVQSAMTFEWLLPLLFGLMLLVDGVEHTQQHMWENFGQNQAAQHNALGKADSQFDGLGNALGLAGTVIVADNGHHAVVNAKIGMNTKLCSLK